MVMIKDALNPFSFEVGTRKAAIESTVTLSLNVVTNGETKRKTFINECHRDPASLKKSIKRQKLVTFSNVCGKQKTKTRDGKIITVCYMRYLF